MTVIVPPYLLVFRQNLLLRHNLFFYLLILSGVIQCMVTKEMFVSISKKINKTCCDFGAKFAFEACS